jgi:lipopolysaccharide biosynthesis protein
MPKIFSFIANKLKLNNIPDSYSFKGFLDFPQDNAPSTEVTGWFVTKKPFFKVVACFNGKEVMAIPQNTIRPDVPFNSGYPAYRRNQKSGFHYLIPNEVIMKSLGHRTMKKFVLTIRLYLDRDRYVDKFSTPFFLVNESAASRQKEDAKPASYSHTIITDRRDKVNMRTNANDLDREELYFEAEQSPDVATADIKPIAFYFPQFHPFLENEKFWGKGFTEWTNTTKAEPLFEGHYQPRLPGELGFYDLRVVDVMKRQVELAKQYGIYGFCFHHYWFSGKPVMRLPLNNFLAHPEIDFKFCLHWANEPWTIRWDGCMQGGVLLGQNHTPEDDLAFIRDITPALKDKRYIKINGKPLLIIYRPLLFPDIKATVRRWQEHCDRAGIGELYMTAMQPRFDVNSDEPLNPKTIGFDAAIEYPPHFVRAVNARDQVNLYDKSSTATFYSFPEVIAGAIEKKKPNYKLFRGVMADFDATPRRKNASVFLGSSPARYQYWLEKMCEKTKSAHKKNERLVFINAWNEWAEGAYLEPDRKYGYAYLNATARALQDGRYGKVAVVAHIYYDDLANEFVSYLKNIPVSFDLYVSTKPEARKKLNDLFKKHFGENHVEVRAVKNIGRDMAPFVVEFRDIYQKYDLVCWAHSKKSLYDETLKDWRGYLLDNLLGSEKVVENILNYFKSDKKLGVVFPEYFPPIKDKVEWGSNKSNVLLLSKKMGVPINENDAIEFPAGAMFWFRPKALAPLFDAGLTLKDFENYTSRNDGTFAHAIERVILYSARGKGFSSKKVLFKPWIKDRDKNDQTLIGSDEDMMHIEKNIGRIAVVAHLYYDDLAEELAKYLKNIPVKFDLYVSTRPEARARLEELFQGYFGKKRVKVKGVKNRGLDIAPFLTEFHAIYGKYDLICKVHGKKSMHCTAHQGWRGFLFDNLLGSTEVVRTIFSYFSSDPQIGLLSPVYYSSMKGHAESYCWGENWSKCNKVLRKIGIKVSKDYQVIFPAGSMFWFRPKALKEIFDLKLSLDDFEGGNILDKGLSHAIERLLGIVAERSGYKYKRVLFFPERNEDA